MVHNDVVCSGKSNCIDRGTKILTVSSKSRVTSNGNDSKNVECAEDPDLPSQEFLDSCQYVDDMQDHSIAYMASVIEAKIFRASRHNRIVKCEQCISVFIENELIEDSFIRFKSRNSNILQPCKSTFEVCKYVDSYLKAFEGKAIPYGTVALQILRKISFDALFVQSTFENHPGSSDRLAGHRYELVKSIVDLYMRMKSVVAARKLTLKMHENPMRHTYRKLIHFEGE